MSPQAVDVAEIRSHRTTLGKGKDAEADATRGTRAKETIPMPMAREENLSRNKRASPSLVKCQRFARPSSSGPGLGGILLSGGSSWCVTAG